MPSYSEMIVIAIVILCVIKPKDITHIKTIVKSILEIFNDIKILIHDVIDKIDTKYSIKDQRNNKTDIFNIDHADEINFYISKIIDLGQIYEGEYDLSKIRKYYYEILKKQCNKNLHIEKQNDIILPK